jgi:hypothetical protein
VASNTRSRTSVRSPVRSACETLRERSLSLASNAGLTATKAATSTLSAACSSTVGATPITATSRPASAGPMITARLRLVASTALA